MNVEGSNGLPADDNNLKRRMKTPIQLETLERVYAVDRYPPEAVRAELSAQLSLTDKQLQMWFCHRRLKDRKGKEDDSPAANVARKKSKTDKNAGSQYPGAVLASDPGDATLLTGNHYTEELVNQGLERFAQEEAKPRPKKGGPKDGEFPGKRRSQALAARAAEAELLAIAKVESQLGEPLREDGPPLGIEFDPLPRGAFGLIDVTAAEPALGTGPGNYILDDRVYDYPDMKTNKPSPLQGAALGLPPLPNSAGTKRKPMGPPTGHHIYEPRSLREFQFLPEQPMERAEETQFFERAATQLNLFPVPDQSYEMLAASRMEEARLAKELEAHEKRIRKELEKQELLRRKKDEQLRKEQEKIDRERRREEEKVLRERTKEEERIQREHKREIERQEKLLLKETKRIEKLRRKEELRKEKEAAKLKAANERAMLKRLAKEMTDLMDDDQLELMEAMAAASAQGLGPSSMGFLDSAGMPTFDASQVMLKSFPPASVRMKAPLSVPPWTDSDQNVGNLAMVWRFLTTFADVVGLWPFTLDELVQAFHDYDPRLLSEIHVALLKIMVKDIEDAAQAVAFGTAGSRDAIAIASGGHPQLVEAAYGWGFDVREWGKHVNPLTWPEVFRQFALAAGFGPKWKKRKIMRDHPRTDVEREEREDAVSILRSGAAAVNAVVLMQGKGFGHLRRGSQYRLTPGTVKYAAFHVLTLEGAKGLNILDVADRIQSTGLRDLSTSRTPEASIAAALSRDTNLFERVAPSTYCVRPAFRKDLEDAAEVLHAAREKIRLFRSGLLDGEEVEKEVDDAERDEYESEGQDGEDVEDVEEVEVPVSSGKNFQIEESNAVEAVGSPDKGKPLVTQDRGIRGSESPDADDSGRVMIEGAHDMLKQEEAEGREEGLQFEGCQKPGVHPEEETEIDESQVGELWVQGLMEGEYADLSVEERLNALVALVTTVNQGNAIRVALEERLEAATALKRQMWAEMQLEKRRYKEEQLSRSNFLAGAPKPDGESPEFPADMVVGGLSCVEPKREGLIDAQNQASPLVDSSAGNEKNIPEMPNGLLVQDANFALAPVIGGHLTEKSRAQAKANIGLRAEELYVFRSLPLGCDRRHNRYWQFVTGNGGQDPGAGRVFFESYYDGHWEVIDTEEALDALMVSLDTRGAREAALYAVLHRLEGTLRQVMSKKVSGGGQQLLRLTNTEAHSLDIQSLERGLSLRALEGSPASSVIGPGFDTPEIFGALPVELGRTGSEKRRALERYREMERWLWTECFTGGSALRAAKSGNKRDTNLLLLCDVCHELYWPKDKHCYCCHATFDSQKPHSKFLEHTRECEDKFQRGDPSWKSWVLSAAMPSRLQLLKAYLLAMELAIPAEALKVKWTEQQCRSWAAALKSASGPSEVLQALTALESMIERDWLASTYETTEELLESLGTVAGSFSENQGTGQALVPHWVPPTTAAVALRASLLDGALAYNKEDKQRREKQEKDDENNQMNALQTKIGLSSTFRFTPEGLPCDPEEDRPGDMLDTSASGRGRGRSRTQGGRGRGGRGGQGGGRRRSITVVGGSKSKARNSGLGRGSKRKLQFQDGSVEATTGDAKQVWGGAGKGRSARGASRARGRSTKRGRSRAGARTSGRRSQTGTQRPERQKQRNPNELTVPSARKLTKKMKLVADAGLVEQEQGEDEEEEEESNGGGSQAGGEWEAPEEGYEDGDQYDVDNQEIDDDEGDEENGSEMVEGEEEEEEEQAEGEEEEDEGQDDDDSFDRDDPDYGGVRMQSSRFASPDREDEEGEEAGDINSEEEEELEEAEDLQVYSPKYSDEE